MNNLYFYYLAAENFLCFGPEGIELNLSDYGNIVLIKGENLDVQNEEEKIASNGCGKSSTPEILVYTLFGKTIKQPKKLTHKNVINNKTCAKLRTEVRWGDFRVVRTRKPDSLRIWESRDRIWDDSTEITLGGMPATQKLIEEKIGLNYETFVNIVIFTDNNAGSFLECDGPAKREIVENLLSLDKYRVYAEDAKQVKNDLKDTIKLLGQSYAHLITESNSRFARIAEIEKQEADWRSNKSKELGVLFSSLESKTKELESTDLGAALSVYNQAQSRLSELNESVLDLDQKKAKIENIVEDARSNLEKERTKHRSLMSEIEQHKIVINRAKTNADAAVVSIKRLESEKNTKCTRCFGIVSPENYGAYVEQQQQIIDDNLAIEKEKNSLIDVIKKEADNISSLIKNLEEAVAFGSSKVVETTTKLAELRKEIIQLSKIPKPEVGVHEKVLQERIEDLHKQIASKEEEINGPSPFVSILLSAKEESANKKLEVEAKKKELEEAETELPYFEFWVKAFGDSGIRKFVIEGIIPTLNSRAAYWLQFLIDGKIKITFDNELEETIERNPPDGDPFVYAAMSGGERRRLCLTVCHSFAYIRMLNAGVSISPIFLDEVTTNIDPIGVVGVYNMIVELAKEKQVFVTTHDQSLLDMLEGCQAIKLRKKNGFTTLV